MTDSMHAVATTIVIMEYIPDVFSMTYNVPEQMGLADVMNDQTNPAMVDGAQ
jgi:hypothetical protein